MLTLSTQPAACDAVVQKKEKRKKGGFKSEVQHPGFQ
jgi:hypothetical protein